MEKTKKRESTNLLSLITEGENNSHSQYLHLIIKKMASINKRLICLKKNIYIYICQSYLAPGNNSLFSVRRSRT